MSLIKCENLVIGYDQNPVCDELNFEVNRGDYLCILGENGSGKSTLMKTLLGLQKKISGKIIFDSGVDKTKIGYLPQHTSVQKDFPASVMEIVLSGFVGKMGIRPFYTKKEKQTALENMELMGITQLKNRCFRELSGGQQQRVLLARALCATSKILLLDEPITGLDPYVSEEMYNLIDRLNKLGVTIIMISHDMNASLKYATKILEIKDGVFYGYIDEYIERGQKNG